MTDTARLGLPLIDGQQALKHVTHNEALARLDAAVQIAVEQMGATTPPVSPEAGEIWGVGGGASGDWFGADGALALFTDSGWRFVMPGEGWLAWNKGEGALYVHLSGGWVAFTGVVDALNNLGLLGVNTTADVTNRLAVRSNAALMTALAGDDGGSGDLRVVLNKEMTGNTASLVFQTGYSGRAEFGLAGDDDFSIKVSPDGSTFHPVLTASAASGFVGFNALFGAEVSFPGVESGVLAVTTSYAVPAPENGSVDDIDTISGGEDGALLILSGSAGITLTVRDGSGNLKLGGDRVLDNFEDTLMLVKRGNDWLELGYADNG